MMAEILEGIPVRTKTVEIETVPAPQTEAEPDERIKPAVVVPPPLVAPSPLATARLLPSGDPVPSTSKGVTRTVVSHPEVPSSLLKNDSRRREKLYKVLVIGDIGTGKTSIVKRYVHRFFSQQYRATIGVDFALKIINWDLSTVIRLQLWDIAGQERFGHMTRVYYKDAVGAFVVFDLARPQTFEAVAKWKKDLDIKVETPDGNSVPCVLLGNKCDQARETQIPEGPRMDHFLREMNFSGYFETSAKENIGIDEAARYLLAKIIENDHPSPAEPDPDRLRLDSSPTRRRESPSNQHPSKCAC